MNEQTEFEVTEAMLVYLDELRESGVTNMLGAGPYLQQTFGLDKKDARTALVRWIETYTDRHGRV